MKKHVTAGIDLGTTNSVVAMMGTDNKTIMCYMDPVTKQRTVPSVVAVNPRTQGLIVGRKAFMLRGTIPEPVVSIKRRMGDRQYRTALGDRQVSPIDVSSEIVKELVRLMQDQLSGTPGYEDHVVSSVVITVPAHFGLDAKEATTLAAEKAGFTVEMLLQEPSASAVYYCYKNEIDDGIFMVYDLGGGTFDLSILRRDGGETSVVTTSGDNYCGGDSFDELLARFLLEKLKEDDYNFDGFDENKDPDDARCFTKLKLEAEIIKKALSNTDEYYVDKCGLFLDKDGRNVNLQFSISRDEFDALIRDTVEHTVDICRDTLKKVAEKNITLDMIDAVLLVGGSTHVPLVQEMIRQAFCDPALEMHTKSDAPLRDEPDMAVGYGAAICAAGRGVRIEADAPVAGKKPLMPRIDNPKMARGKSKVTGVIGGADAYGQLVAVVTRDDGSFRAEFPIGTDGAFAFAGLPADGEIAMYTVSIMEKGETVFSFPFNAVGIAAGEAPVTMSHSYYVDAIDPATGKVEKQVLIEEGAQLPATREIKLVTNPESNGLLVLFIYEGTNMLRKIEVPFDENLPGGTPVKIALQVAATQVISMQAQVGDGAPHEETLEPPVHKKISPEEVSEAVGIAREAVGYLERVEQHKKTVQLNRLRDKANAALDADDQHQLREVMDAVRSLVEPPKQLEPTKDAFDAKIREAQDINRNHKGNDAEIGRQIEALRSAGYRCYQEQDQALLTDTFTRLSKLADSLKPAPTGGSDAPLWQRVQGFCAFLYRRLSAAHDIHSGKITEMPTGKGPDGSEKVERVRVTNMNAGRAAKIPQVMKELEDLFRKINEYASEDTLGRIVENLRRIHAEWEDVEIKTSSGGDVGGNIPMIG